MNGLKEVKRRIRMRSVRNYLDMTETIYNSERLACQTKSLGGASGILVLWTDCIGG